MDLLFKNILLVIFLSVWIFQNSFSQFDYLNNPSIEADHSGAFVPDGWAACESWSDPDIANMQYDISAIDGSMLALLRVRGATYGTVSRQRTTEYMSNKLLQPLRKNYCYHFSIYICNVNTEVENDLQDNYTHPVKFQIWGTNDTCSPQEFFNETNVIYNTSFNKYELTFSVNDTDYKYLYIRPYWDTSISVIPYNGIVLIDNLTLEKIKEPTPPTDTTVYFKIKPPLTLNASDGSSWDWNPKVYLSNYNLQNVRLLNYHDYYTVKITDSYGCFKLENFNIIYNCDSVYHKTYFNEYNVYYKTTPVYLYASQGESYSWNTSFEGLSDYSIKNPRILTYNPRFVVTIRDESYKHCEYNELFNIIVNCDTLFPNIETLILDTTIQYGEEVNLKPKYGEVNGPWQPDKNLSCADCPVTVAKPSNSTLYTVELKNEYQTITCTHNELFNIDVEFQIPNVISPGDVNGKNDYFAIPGLPENSSVKIFDKTGKLIFEASPYNENNWWKGTILNTSEKVNSGNYWYALDIPGKKNPFTGFVFVVW